MMEELTQLLKALTPLAVEATTYLARQNGAMLPLTAGVSAVVPAEAPKKERKTRTPKAPEASSPVDPMSELGLPAAPAKKALTEAESQVETLTVAKRFVQRFARSAPDGLVRAKEILKTMFNAEKIASLGHAQRLEFIAVLEKQMAEEA